MSDERGSSPPDLPLTEAAYLHARSPADARIVLWREDGLDPLAGLPSALRKGAGKLSFQILLPVEESTLRPVPAQPGEDDEDRPQERVAPSLWTIPGDALPLAVAVPWLAEQDPRSLRPSMRLLALACRLAMQMRGRGDFAPAPQPGSPASRPTGPPSRSGPWQHWLNSFPAPC